MMNVNPISANPTKWSNTLKQFVDKLPTNCLSVFDHFVNLALKGLKSPNANTLADGLIERTSSMLDEIASKTVHKSEENDQRK